jgi:hypothetical protein
MPTNRFLKLLLLILLAPLILIAWTMMCVGQGKDISLQNRRSTGVSDTQLEFICVRTPVNQEAPEMIATEHANCSCYIPKENKRVWDACMMVWTRPD